MQTLPRRRPHPPPPEADPLDADPPRGRLHWMLVMLPVMHTGKPTPPPPWTETNTCENTTLPKTSFAGGNNSTGTFTLLRQRQMKVSSFVCRRHHSVNVSTFHPFLCVKLASVSVSVSVRITNRRPN